MLPNLKSRWDRSARGVIEVVVVVAVVVVVVVVVVACYTSNSSTGNQLHLQCKHKQPGILTALEQARNYTVGE